jgi:hypothetical protein
VARSIRVFYGEELGLHGRCRMNFNWENGEIGETSVLHISAAQAMSFGSASVFGRHGGPGQDFAYLLGDADVWVSNISPHQGGVEFILHVNSPQPLNIAVTITVEQEDPDQFRVTR